jgi:hypothetical protein
MPFSIEPLSDTADALGGKHGSSRFCRPVPASVLSIAMRHSA